MGWINKLFTTVSTAEGDMHDYAHAARLYTDNFNRLTPKVQFLYHVYFEIDSAVQRIAGIAASLGFLKSAPNTEAGMLVKSVNLPSVSVQTQTFNQYGKKTNVQTRVDYQPVTFTFHDDNADVVNGMWQQYFKATYADSQYADALGRQVTYNSPNGKQQPIKFGLDSNRSRRFFRRISIYQLSQHKFSEFTLINPMIQEWRAPNMDNSSSQPAENQMSVIYEGIKYGSGVVSTNNPDGFASLHYDKNPSPLGLFGGGTPTLFGAGGVLAGGLDVVGDLFDPRTYNNPFALIGTAIKAKNTYDNAKQLTKEGVSNELENIGARAIDTAARSTVLVAGQNGYINSTRGTQVPGVSGAQPGQLNVQDTSQTLTGQGTTETTPLTGTGTAEITPVNPVVLPTDASGQSLSATGSIEITPTQQTAVQ